MGHEKARILVVDDEPLNLRILVELLSPLYTILVARDGTSVLRLLEGARLPDLILSDVVMPDMDGVELCRKIKEDERLAEIPLIFVTALDSDHEEVVGFAAGAIDYVTKPISPATLLARISAHLSLNQGKKCSLHS